jgi:hypothetical protein
MDSKAVIEVIRRHQAKFRERCRSRAGLQRNDEGQSDFRIAEEYDSLLAEIELLGGTAPLKDSDQQTNEAAESQILGDQGQSGG